MAHAAQQEFVARVRDLLPRHFRDAKVLEVGSLDVNGSVRPLFERCDYTGIDVGPGRGVDVVCEGHAYDAPEGSYDTVISCEALEHDPHWSATFANMVRLVRPDGLLVMTCALTGRPEHGTARADPGASPLTVAKGWDHYRNLCPRDFAAAGVLGPLRTRVFVRNWLACDLYFVGAKQPLERDAARGLAAIRRRHRKRCFGTLAGLARFARAHLPARR